MGGSALEVMSCGGPAAISDVSGFNEMASARASAPSSRSCVEAPVAIGFSGLTSGFVRRESREVHRPAASVAVTCTGAMSVGTSRSASRAFCMGARITARLSSICFAAA